MSRIESEPHRRPRTEAELRIVEEGNKPMLLRDVLPFEFVRGEYSDTKAYALRDVEVVREHSVHEGVHRWVCWPGTERYVCFWVELSSGHIIGWNENPSRGWSFPVRRKK